MRLVAAVSLALLAAAAGCSSTTTGTGGGSDGSSGGSGTGRVSLDAAAMCERYLDECKQTSLDRVTCVKSFSILRVTPECASMLDAATCEELEADGSTVDKACFPSCSTPGQARCNGDDTITICSDAGRSLVSDCTATCRVALSKSYTGVCGKSYGGETATTDKCWCE